MADVAHRNWILRNRLLVLAIVIVVVVAAVLGFVLTGSSNSKSPTVSTSTSSGACTKGGTCGYDNVSPADAVEIIANQTNGPGSITTCSATNGQVGIASMKGTGSSEWDCTNAQSGAVATYTINPDGSVDY